ncbi:MAG: UDP-N-acetylmuramate--L-alanine ligase [Actinomycetes bacterium]
MSGASDWSDRQLHFVGIGGAGMSGWATVAAELGASVSGSDANDSAVLEALASRGIAVASGHDAANLPAGSGLEVVRSSAIADGNVELVAARERGLRVMERAELLDELTALRSTIAIAGAHGKTTTTSMAAQILIECGRDPGYLIGGELRSTGRNAAWGSGDWLIVEADESDRSMLSINADVAVVTNIELDHHANYGSLSELREVFREFLSKPEQVVIPDAAEMLELRGGLPAIAFKVDSLELLPGGSKFQWRGEQVQLRVPGAHNAANAVAALEAALLAGAEPAEAAAAIGSFTGAGRRFELLGKTSSGAVVIDDYAHHPTEVAATIAAARTLEPERLVAVFQPHLFSRTERLAGEFGRALAEADLICVVDIYEARERAEDFPGVDGRLIAAAAADAANGREVLWLPGLSLAREQLGTRLRRGDVCLVLGAGDVRSLGEDLAVEPSS